WEIPVLNSSGYGDVITNIGEIKNWGWEFTLKSVNSVRALRWTTNFNISFNRNEVLALRDDEEPIITGGTHITAIGKPMGQFYGRVVDGIYQNQAEVDAGATYAGIRPGG